MDVADADGAVRVNVIVRRLQRTRIGVWTVAVLNPSIFKVRLQLSDMIVGLGLLLRGGLLVGFAGIHWPVVKEEAVIWRDFSPLDGD